MPAAPVTTTAPPLSDWGIVTPGQAPPIQDWGVVKPPTFQPSSYTGTYTGGGAGQPTSQQPTPLQQVGIQQPAPAAPKPIELPVTPSPDVFSQSLPVVAILPQQLAEFRAKYPERFYRTEGPGTTFERFYTGSVQENYISTQYGGRTYEFGVSKGVAAKFNETILTAESPPSQAPSIEQIGAEKFFAQNLVSGTAGIMATAFFTPHAAEFWGGVATKDWAQVRTSVYRQYGETALNKGTPQEAATGAYRFFTEAPVGMLASGIIFSGAVAGSAIGLTRLFPEATSIAKVASPLGQKISTIALAGTGAALEGTQAWNMLESGASRSTVTAKTLMDIGTIGVGIKVFQGLMPVRPPAPKRDPTISVAVEEYGTGAPGGPDIGLIKAKASTVVGGVKYTAESLGPFRSEPADLSVNNAKIPAAQEPSLGTVQTSSVTASVAPKDSLLTKLGTKGMLVTIGQEQGAGIGTSFKNPVQVGIEKSTSLGIDLSKTTSAATSLEYAKIGGRYVEPSYVQTSGRYFFVNYVESGLATGRTVISPKGPVRIGKTVFLPETGGTKYPVDVSVNVFKGKFISKDEFLSGIAKKPEGAPVKQFKLLGMKGDTTIDISPPEKGPAAPKTVEKPFEYLREQPKTDSGATQLLQEEAPKVTAKTEPIIRQAAIAAVTERAVINLVRILPPTRPPNIFAGTVAGGPFEGMGVSEGPFKLEPTKRSELLFEGPFKKLAPTKRSELLFEGPFEESGTRTDTFQKEGLLSGTRTDTFQKEGLLSGTLSRQDQLSQQRQESKQIQDTLTGQQQRTEQATKQQTRQEMKLLTRTPTMIVPRAPSPPIKPPVPIIIFGKNKAGGPIKRQPIKWQLGIRRGVLKAGMILIPKRDIFTREFESMRTGGPLKPIPQTAATRKAYGAKLFGTGSAFFRFGPAKRSGR